jgi:hypothetical protein
MTRARRPHPHGSSKHAARLVRAQRTRFKNFLPGDRGPGARVRRGVDVFRAELRQNLQVVGNRPHALGLLPEYLSDSLNCAVTLSRVR